MDIKLKLTLFIFVCMAILLNSLAYLNMIINLGFPFSVKIFVGPTSVSLLMTFILYILMHHYTNQIKEIEDKKHLELEDTQREIIFKMGEVGESRSSETGHHVKRVAEYSRLLSSLYGLTEKEITLLSDASPMHDIGKVAIADNILLKPEKLTDAEFTIMKDHAQIGYDILKGSEKSMLEAAAIIAYEHHEKWDGSGYPRGLKGDNIHIYGRITAVADVFDALASKRVYKDIWDDQKVYDYMQTQSGTHFEPKLIELLLNNYHLFLDIRDLYRDT